MRILTSAFLLRMVESCETLRPSVNLVDSPKRVALELASALPNASPDREVSDMLFAFDMVEKDVICELQ